MQWTTLSLLCWNFHSTADHTTQLPFLPVLLWLLSHLCPLLVSPMWFSPHFHKESVIRPSSQFAKVYRMIVLPLKLSCTLILPRFMCSHAFVPSSIPTVTCLLSIFTDTSHTSKPQYDQQQLHHHLPKMVLPRFTQMLMPLPDNFCYPFSHTSHFQPSVTSVPGDQCSLLASAGITNTWCTHMKAKLPYT